MIFVRTPIAATLGLLVLLQACAQAPQTPQEQAPAVVEQDIPELTLNLPEDNGCVCTDEDAADYTFLERGFAALAEGEHVEAVQHFQRYQRLEDSPEASWESGMAIAYISTLSHSPFYDPEAAVRQFRQLNQQEWKDMELHQQSLLMRHSVKSFVVQNRHINDLEGTNETLREDLEKREEALKRLRELTLGQKGSRQ